LNKEDGRRYENMNYSTEVSFYDQMKKFAVKGLDVFVAINIITSVK